MNLIIDLLEQENFKLNNDITDLLNSINEKIKIEKQIIDEKIELEKEKNELLYSKFIFEKEKEEFLNLIINFLKSSSQINPTILSSNVETQTYIKIIKLYY